MNSDNIYVLIKYCIENCYKPLALVEKKNKNASKSSENACPARIFENKSLLKLALVQPLKRKIQMRQKTLKTLVLINVIRKTNKNLLLIKGLKTKKQYTRKS